MNAVWELRKHEQEIWLDYISDLVRGHAEGIGSRRMGSAA
jgi:hypothetical protein